MVILKVLLDRGETRSAHGRVLLGMLIVQDLAVVVLSVLLPRVVNSPDQIAYVPLLGKRFGPHARVWTPEAPLAEHALVAMDVSDDTSASVCARLACRWWRSIRT